MLQTDIVLHTLPVTGNVLHRSRLPRWSVAAASVAAAVALLAVAVISLRSVHAFLERARSFGQTHRMIEQVTVVVCLPGSIPGLVWRQRCGS